MASSQDSEVFEWEVPMLSGKVQSQTHKGMAIDKNEIDTLFDELKTTGVTQLLYDLGIIDQIYVQYLNLFTVFT